VLVTALAKGLQESLDGRHAVHVAGHRLDDDRRDAVTVLGKCVAHPLGVVKVERHGVLRKVGGHARRGGNTEGERARTRLDQ
jgi:hypothetical protein